MYSKYSILAIEPTPKKIMPILKYVKILFISQPGELGALAGLEEQRGVLDTAEGGGVTLSVPGAQAGRQAAILLGNLGNRKRLTNEFCASRGS